MRPIIVAVLAMLTLAACESESSEAADYSTVIAFDSAPIRIVSGSDTVRLLVEIARTTQQKTQGLMERQSMPDSTGMLFVYDDTQPADAGFWMFRTRIPLDIAFADSAGVIVSIRSMEPCTAQLAAGCPTYMPDAEYRYALEVNRGYFAARGIRVGSRILLGEVAARR